MTEIKIIDNQTLLVDGNRFIREVPDVATLENDVYLEKPKYREVYFINGSLLTWHDDGVDNEFWNSQLLYKTKEASNRAFKRQKLLVRLQRECLKMGGVIERTKGYDYIIWEEYRKLIPVNAIGFGYFNFQTHNEYEAFIAANESDLKEFFNEK